MEKESVLLTIRGTQQFEEEAPQTIELTTGGTMEGEAEHWTISYIESELTGLAGAVTTFEVTPGKVVLERSGSVNSRMVFVEGEQSESLYDVGDGALLIHVTATKVEIALDEMGGHFCVCYAIDIEQSAQGKVEYYIKVQKREA